ncbi:MAG: YraN family protein, partial [Oscillibacter sp.]|nr:YraN family protein [Oscillibacter sp.]
WRCRFGELDLVARDKAGTVCFVEVKLRAEVSIALPREFVTEAKRRRLRATALMYLQQNAPDATARFDVAEVYDEGGTLRVSYLENAFE